MFPSYRNQSVDLQSTSAGFYIMGTLVVKGLRKGSTNYEYLQKLSSGCVLLKRCS